MNWLRQRRRDRQNKILSALRGGAWTPGLAIAERAGVGYGQTVAELAAFEHTGVVESRWLEGDPPRRRLYRLADAYECPRCHARMALKFVVSHERICAWAERWEALR